MPRLDVYADFRPILSVRLDDRGELLIGRGAECGVRIPGEEVSRRHARIVAQGGRHAIEDLSRNGTLLNGERLDGRHTLRPGDRLLFGGRVLLYQPDDAPVEDLERALRAVGARGQEERALPLRPSSNHGVVPGQPARGRRDRRGSRRPDGHGA